MVTKIDKEILGALNSLAVVEEALSSEIKEKISVMIGELTPDDVMYKQLISLQIALENYQIKLFKITNKVCEYE